LHVAGFSRRRGKGERWFPPGWKPRLYVRQEARRYNGRRQRPGPVFDRINRMDMIEKRNPA